MRDVHALREHYVRTVDAWYRTFEDNWDRAVGLVGEEVARVWRLYLVGGAMAFRDGRMGVDQILAVRPDSDGASSMPPVRLRRVVLTEFSVSNFLAVSGFSLLAVAILMTVTALVGRRQGRVSVVDTAWGLGFVVVAAGGRGRR